jgi:Uma2 family endonuclease
MSDSYDTKASQEAHSVNTAAQRALGSFRVNDWYALDEPEDGSSIELLWGHFLLHPRPSGQHQHSTAELCLVLKAALRDAGRHDLYPVMHAGAEISAEWRTGLIPDVIVVNVRPIGYPLAENLLLVAETWSPDNAAKERADKAWAYALAGVPQFWTLDQDEFGKVTTVTAHRLDNGTYVEEMKAVPGTMTEFEVAGVPVKFDPADLAS